MAKFSKQTKLAKLLASSKAVKILAKYNVPCLTCPFAKLEMENLEIGEICKMYKIKLNPLLKELNKV